MQKKQGFTLIEMLVVIAIIAILTSIAIPTYLKYKKKAVISRIQSDLVSCAGELMAEFADNGTMRKVCRVYDSNDTCTLIITYAGNSSNSSDAYRIKIASSQCIFNVKGLRVVCDIDTNYNQLIGYIHCHE